MLTLNIQNAAVRANIALIIDAIRQDRLSIAEKQKSLQFSIHRETGLLQRISVTNEYLSIELHLDLGKRDVSITEKESKQVVNLEVLSQTARRVMSETCSEIKKTFSSIHDLRELSYFEISRGADRSLLHEAWMAVDRTEAEKLLLKTQGGTYLFRKDPFAGCLQELLVSARKEPIKCFTLTYLDLEGQVHDKTIIQWKDHWMFYDDDPTLSGDYYLSCDDLLLSLASVLKQPLSIVKENRPA